MEAPFPFGFPFATGFYLAWYVVTLVIHVMFMNYVLAGSMVLAVNSVFSGTTRARQSPSRIVHVLRDWMPFALSAAITTGVAPLLFLQILYRRSFYTANLLLFHRWMAILPVLIVAFYLLYLLKARKASTWPTAGRALVGVGAFLCFGFVAYSWTENYLLSASPTQWVEFYASRSLTFYHAQLLVRLGVWFVGSFATMLTMLAWQLRHAERSDTPESSTSDSQRVSRWAMCGIGLTVLCGVAYLGSYPAAGRTRFASVAVTPYLWGALAGVALQLGAWAVQMRSSRFRKGPLLCASVGVAATVLGMSVVREGLRLSVMDLDALYPMHQAAAEIGGLGAFLTFFLLNALLIAWCFRLVGRGLKSKSAATAG